MPSDLGLRFDGPETPARVTAVLAACSTEDPEIFQDELEDAVWALPLGERILRLLKLVALTEGGPALAVTSRCPAPSCGQAIELALPYDDLFALAEAARPPENLVHFPRTGGGSLALRLPTARDAEDWRGQAFATEGEAAVAMIEALLAEGGPVATDEIGSIAAALEQADPLVAFHVDTGCPFCGQRCDLPIDLEVTALRQLAACRLGLLREVHFFATHYGWGESEVLSIPADRRAEYRMLISRQEDGWP